VVSRCTEFRGGSRNPRMFRLSSHGRHVSLICRGFLLGGSTHLDAAGSAVEANTAFVAIVYFFVVDIVDSLNVHVVHRTVIVKVSVVPTAAIITLAEVSKAVVNSAIEPDLRAPVAVIEKESAVSPTPIAWGPEETLLRRLHPRAGNPVVIGDAVVICPVTRDP